MLHVWGDRQKSNCAGTTRRDFLKIGALGMGGLALPDLLRARATAAADGRSRRNSSVVWLWLGGGPSHIETFDPHMTAPAEYRSVVGATRTNVSGVEIGGVFPRLAGVADKMAFVRSFGHGNANHGGASHWVMTGHDFPRVDDGLGQRQPGLGAILARQRGPDNPATGMPTYVSLGGILGDGPSWLGQAHAPFDVPGSACGSWNPQLTVERLQERRSLLCSFDALHRQVEASGLGKRWDRFQAQAVETVLDRARDLFDLAREEPRTLELYGTSNLSRQLLLARRLCAAGVGFVTVHFGGWDMHGQIAQGMRELGPRLDQAVAAFVQDVHQRGLEKDILLVITGEFGRTPRLNSGGGRDHWAPLAPLALAGGGLRMGQVVGQSSARAEVARTTPLTPQDLMATIFHVLGIPQDLKCQDSAGRPRLFGNGGRPIAELV